MLPTERQTWPLQNVTTQSLFFCLPPEQFKYSDRADHCQQLTTFPFSIMEVCTSMNVLQQYNDTCGTYLVLT